MKRTVFSTLVAATFIYYQGNASVMAEYVSNEYTWCEVPATDLVEHGIVKAHTRVDMGAREDLLSRILSKITLCYSTVAACTVVMSCVLSYSYFCC